MAAQEIEERIERVFAAKSNADLIENYQGWAERYDADMQSLGYRNITALDLSAEMLELARGKGCYQSLVRDALGEPLDFPNDRFAAIVCAGTFTAGHAHSTNCCGSRCRADTWSLPSVRRPMNRADFVKNWRIWSGRAVGN